MTIARPCNLWVAAAGSSTCCAACRLYSIGATRNAMPPMQASRCNGSGCDYGNGLVSPGNPLTYDGRRMSSIASGDECGASHTGVAPDETPTPASPAIRGRRCPPALGSRSTLRLASSTLTTTLRAEGDESVCPLAIVASQDTIATANASSSSVEITGTDNARTRHAGRFHPYSSSSQRKRQHQHQRAAAVAPACPAPPTWPAARHAVSGACSGGPRGVGSQR